MLVLKRKIGDRVIIDGCITVKVLSIGKSGMKLGIDAPRDIDVQRAELVEFGTDADADRPVPPLVIAHAE